MEATPSRNFSARRPAGRPRRLTIDAIIAAACELGFDQIEMSAIAERLGVGVATLYGYVQGRDHLVRLVADCRAHRGVIADNGQSWQDVLREHAARTFANFGSWPQLIVQVMNGALGPQFEAEYLDRLLALLLDRGVAPADALSLYYEVNQIVVGAAVGAAYLKAMREAAGGHESVTQLLLASRAETELPTLRRCAGYDKASPPVLGDYSPPLERLLADYTNRMSSLDAAVGRTAE